MSWCTSCSCRDALHALADEPTRAHFERRGPSMTRGRVLLSHLGYEEEEIGDAIGYFGIF